MSLPSLEGLTKEQLKALVAEANKALKAGITSADPEVIEAAGKIKAIAEKHKISTDKVIAAVKGALGGKAAGGERKQSAINVIRKALKEKGLGPFPVGAEGNEQARTKYAEVFGKDALAQVDAEFPPSPSAKYKK